MSTTTTTPSSTRPACPAECVHGDEYAAHEVFISTEHGDRPVIQHETHLGQHVYGTLLRDVITGEQVEAGVIFSDLEQPHGPTTPEGLETLAASVLAAASWLREVQRDA